MESLLDIRMGKCVKGADVVGFAAAGAVASSGRLIDITKLYVNVTADEYKPSHAGYTSESVLSGTLPIIEVCKGYSTVVYMTSRKFTYSSYCLDVLMGYRKDNVAKRTLAVTHMDDNTFSIVSDDASMDVTADKAMDIVTRELSSPMSCALCDWEGVPLFDDMRRTTRATMWWYPATLGNPLISVATGESTSYYARAYSSRDGYCIMTGGYYNLRDSTPEVSDYVSARWDAYDKLLQSQTCSSGECFSCSYLRSCITRYDHNEKKQAEMTFDVLLNI